MVALLQAVFSGLALGGIYGLVALGFSITHSTTKTFNFGQGEFLAAGALIGVSVVLMMSGHPITAALNPGDVTPLRYGIAVIVSFAVLGLFGAILYFTAVRPFIGLSGLAWVMSTIGFGIIIQNTALALWGPTPIVMGSPVGNDVIRIAGAGILPQEILVLFASIITMVLLDIVMRKTRFGKAVRAVAHSRNAAILMGINVPAIVVIAFVMSSGLAGMAGILVVPITTASVFMGLSIALKAFSAAILGGLNNPRGCILGAFLLGLMEALIGLWHAELREISIFLVIILVLVFKPEGLLGQRQVEKV